MLFKNNFYIIESSRKEDDSTIYTIQLNKDHSIFNGHFPGNPVTPGVVQMEIVKELVSESFQREIKLDTMSNCKFLAILNPAKDALIDVVLKESETEENQYKVNAVIKNDSTVFLKMNAMYSPT